MLHKSESSLAEVRSMIPFHVNIRNMEDMAYIGVTVGNVLSSKK